MLGSDLIYLWMLLNLSLLIDFKGNPIFKIIHEKAEKEFLQAEGLRLQLSSEEKVGTITKSVIAICLKGKYTKLVEIEKFWNTFSSASRSRTVIPNVHFCLCTDLSQ